MITGLDMTDNTDFFKMLRRMIKAGAVRAGNADEHDLSDFAEIQEFFNEQLKIAIHSQLDQGKSWTDIGVGLGITKQAAHKRFSK